jgi:DNA-directed RNA polymerase specialized sigma24 family protein/ketosteroid isomerase-like protein
MSELDWLAGRFEENRPRLQAMACRMLGSAAEAEDAVQESWLRASRAGAGDIGNLAGFLTTITARVCLNMLEARKSRPEAPAGAHPPEPGGARQGGAGPEEQALLADSVGQALLVVLDAMAPAERVAFVLHDMFTVPFEDIAPIVDRTPAATRQLASRARRRVQGTGPGASAASQGRHHELVAAFLAASQHGDFAALLELLDPGVVYRADQAGVRMGGPGEVRGPGQVAAIFSGRAQAARLATVNGTAAVVWAAGGQPRVVFRFTTDGQAITAIDMTADPADLLELEVMVLGDDRA